MTPYLTLTDVRVSRWAATWFGLACTGFGCVLMGLWAELGADGLTWTLVLAAALLLAAYVFVFIPDAYHGMNRSAMRHARLTVTTTPEDQR